MIYAMKVFCLFYVLAWFTYLHNHIEKQLLTLEGCNIMWICLMTLHFIGIKNTILLTIEINITIIIYLDF